MRDLSRRGGLGKVFWVYSAVGIGQREGFEYMDFWELLPCPG